MSKIVFFSMPVYGHTNPTIEVVRELVNKDNEVIYYSFNEFKEKIEDTGAKCICCDEYLVYTSKEFQPMVETFSDKYYFVGPSLYNEVYKANLKTKKQIYISLSTVNNKNNDFYINCIQAFKDFYIDVLSSHLTSIKRSFLRTRKLYYEKSCG